MKKIYITGISGLLGCGIVRELSDEYDICGADIVQIEQEGAVVENFDLLDYEQLYRSIENNKPDIIIHTAAAINVDRCEEKKEEAYKLNVELTSKIVDICKMKNIKMIYISSDAVYEGSKKGLYTEEDICEPINYYGRTKLEGELVVRELEDYLILRTNIYGRNIQNKKSFGEWVLDSLNNNLELSMFTDIKYSPILVNELAHIIDKCIKKDIKGLYIACATGVITKYDFGILLKDIFNIKTGNIKKSTSDSAQFKAKRSKNMGMSNKKICEQLNVVISTPEESIIKFKELYMEGKYGN